MRYNIINKCLKNKMPQESIVISIDIHTTGVIRFILILRSIFVEIDGVRRGKG